MRGFLAFILCLMLPFTSYGAFSISKGYTPSAGQVADPVAYNTDIAALFNTLNGLQAQTTTMGGLTLTPSSNGVSRFLITNTAGTSLFTADTTNMEIEIGPTYKLYLGADTWMAESSADILDLYVGNYNLMKLTEASTNKVEISTANLEIDSEYKLYFDGGGDTYIQEESTNDVDFCVGGSTVIAISTTNITATADHFTVTSNTFTPSGYIDNTQIIKAWAVFSGTGTIVLRDSYNVAQVTDNGTGDYTVDWDVGFGSAYYSMNAFCGALGRTDMYATVQTPAATSVRITCVDDTGTARDCDYVSVMAIGAR